MKTMKMFRKSANKELVFAVCCLMGIASFAIPESYLCFRPVSGKSSYPWDTADKWYNTTQDGNPVNRLPTESDDVFLYSSKNDVSSKNGKPMLVTNGVNAVRAQAYITCVWSHWHIRRKTMLRMASRTHHPDFAPDIIPNIMPKMRAEKYLGQDFMKNVPPETRNGVHVVVKVLPGGEKYRIYLWDARDESMKILARLDREVV